MGDLTAVQKYVYNVEMHTCTVDFLLRIYAHARFCQLTGK